VVEPSIFSCIRYSQCQLGQSCHQRWHAIRHFLPSNYASPACLGWVVKNPPYAEFGIDLGAHLRDEIQLMQIQLRQHMWRLTSQRTGTYGPIIRWGRQCSTLTTRAGLRIPLPMEQDANR
jgi:hypothetical protein